MRSYAENYPLLYVIVQENLSRLPDDYAEWATAIRRANKEFEDIFVQVISDGMKDGALRKVGPPWIVAYGILGMFGWTSRWFNPSSARRRRRDRQHVHRDPARRPGLTLMNGAKIRTR